MNAVLAITKGGRACGRALSTALLTGLCVLGLVLMAQGAMIPAKAWLAQVLLERAFTQSLEEHRPVKPWGWADMAPVARVTMPRLGVSDIVLSGGSGQAMAFGPTVMRDEAPVRIMAAHRDTHFAYLKDVKLGDSVEVQGLDGQIASYRVASTQVVRWDRFAYPVSPPWPLLALTTCYPFGATEHGPLRYVVWAERVDD